MSSTTGDIKNNLSKLLRELKRMNMKIEPNIRGLVLGIPSAFLPILHGALMSYSLPLAQHLSSLGLEMFGRNDLRFVEVLYKVMRDVFQYRPKITRDQFLSIGFAECKVILTVDLLKHCQSKHDLLSGSDRPNKKRHHVRQATNKTMSSFATVHTVAASSGIGSVWQEKVSVISPKPHLPLSPPASPLHSSFTSEGHTIIPEPILELTPLSTPLKGSLSSTSQRSDFSELCDNSPSRGKQVNIISELESFEDVEIITVESKDTVNGSDHQETGEDKEDASDQKLSLPRVVGRIERLTTILNKLMNRMILVETQLKILQDRGVVIEKGSGVNIGTQTDRLQVKDASTSPCIVLSETLHRSTLTTPLVPRRTIVTTPIKKSLHHMTTPKHLHQDHTPTVNTGPRTLTFETPIINYESSFVTDTANSTIPVDTQKILSNLRTRAKQTKELLNKANLITSTPINTNPLLNPVN